MSSRAFSSIVLRQIIKDIQEFEKAFDRDGEDWAESIMTKHRRAIQEQPVVYLTKEENSRAREYNAWFIQHKHGWDPANQATFVFRDKHAAEIRKFLNAADDKGLGLIEHDTTEDTLDFLPSDDGPPTCFKEWFAVNQVYRLLLVMPEISFQDAASGTPGCGISHLPKLWEDKLDECMQITDARAILPIPSGYGLPITRYSLESVLPTSDGADSRGLLSNAVMDPWFGILVAQRNQQKRNSTQFIQADSLELVAATPQEVAENAAKVNADLDMILFPTVINGHNQHCILIVAFPKKHVIAVYDSLGPESTKQAQKQRPWIEKKRRQSEKMSWEVKWLKCPQAPRSGANHGFADFMFINALLVCSDKDPLHRYSQEDTLFLRRFIAAVICMKELPQPIWKD